MSRPRYVALGVVNVLSNGQGNGFRVELVLNQGTDHVTRSDDLHDLVELARAILSAAADLARDEYELGAEVRESIAGALSYLDEDGE